MRTPTRWLTRGVRGIGAASVLSDLGHEVATSLLPRLVTQTLGASATVLGLIEGLADGLAGVARFIGGGLADDPQRRRSLAVGGYTATAVLTAGIGVATAPWQVGLLRAGGWASEWDPRDEQGDPIPLEELPLGIAFREGRPAHRAMRIAGGDGVARDIEVTAFPLCAQPELILGAIAVFWERTAVAER